MTKTFAAFAATLTLAACAVAASPNQAQAHNATNAVECTVRETPIRGGMRFEALARSQRTALGEYDFVLTKTDRGGASDIVQGGDFDLRANGEQSLGSVELSLERGARYRARLVLRDGSRVVCRDDVRS